MLSWLAGAADLLVSQAPQVAAELLRQGVASSPTGARHDRFAARLADALYRMGDAAGAERVASHVLAHAVEPDLFVDLHWTLAQCRMRKGSFAESAATMERALAGPGISARHRSRRLVLTARAHCYIGEIEKAGEVATAALGVASEAGDDWAIAWALHVLTLVSLETGRLTEALPLFDRALIATQADPALTDLAAGLGIPHRQATALYCRGLLDHDASGLLAAAECYQVAGRPLLRAQALEAAAAEFARADAHDRARAASAGAAEIYTQLGAAVDGARVQARL